LHTMQRTVVFLRTLALASASVRTLSLCIFYFLFPDICQPTFSKLFHIRRVFAPPQMCYTDLCKVLLKQFQARNRRQAWARTHGGTDRLQTPRPIGASATPMGRCDKMTDKILRLHQCSPQQTKMHPRHSAMLLESGEGK